MDGNPRISESIRVLLRIRTQASVYSLAVAGIFLFMKYVISQPIAGTMTATQTRGQILAAEPRLPK